MKLNKKITSIAALTAITSMMLVGCGVSEEEQAMIDNYSTLESKVQTLEKENKELQTKVDEAKPWFDMKEEERKEEEEKLAKKEEERKQKELEAKSIKLGNGNYVSGEDFEPGTYDIVAVDGSGNISSSNMYSGGLNAMMASDSENFGDLYEQEYKNIELPEGESLKISGVTVKLIPKK